ncbi:MAG: DUF1127 domain-containing protein [Alphaproteobacteria bacterium]
MDPRKAFASGTNDTSHRFYGDEGPALNATSDVAVRAKRLQAEAMIGILSGTYRGAASLAAAVFRLIARWYRRRRTYNELMGCSDRLLADIGLRRDQIAFVTRDVRLLESPAASQILVAESDMPRRHLQAPSGDRPRSANDSQSVAVA